MAWIVPPNSSKATYRHLGTRRTDTSSTRLAPRSPAILDHHRLDHDGDGTQPIGDKPQIAH
jgi:hypothetical protein